MDDSARTPGASFTDLGLAPQLISRLARQGITTPFPIQAATVPDAVAGRDVLGRGRTGSGKTLAFALPLVSRLADAPRARRRKPHGLILAPTRELASQIDAVLAPLAEAVGLLTTTVFGGVPASRQIRALDAGVDIVVACPGRLQDLINTGNADLSEVRVTVLDEADHMADLGFLPVVRRLMDATPRSGQRLLFSATLDRGVDVLVKRYLRDPVLHEIDEEMSAPVAMSHHVLHVDRTRRLAVVADLVASPGKTVVFTRTKRGAKTLTRQLKSRGLTAVELHGDLAQNARTRNLEHFSSGRADVLVATDIAARGSHVDEVTLVVHADPPVEHKAYLHRSGRTARAGEFGVVVTMMVDDQATAVHDLMRKAGIKPVTTRVGVDDEVLPMIGVHSGSTAPVLRRPAVDAATQAIVAPKPGRRTRGRSGRPAAAPSTARQHTAAGFSSGARGR